MSDPYNLQRFVIAQDDGTYDAALAELRAGCKHSHWMWFVFPQIAGLGRSPSAQRFAISGKSEAVAYASHPVLGLRLRECAKALVDSNESDPVRMLEPVDALKLRSSMTLFAETVPDEPAFQQAALVKYFTGAADEKTLDLLQ